MGDNASGFSWNKYLKKIANNSANASAKAKENSKRRMAEEDAAREERARIEAAAARQAVEAEAEFEALKARLKVARAAEEARGPDPEQAVQNARNAERHALGLHTYVNNSVVEARRNELRKIANRNAKTQRIINSTNRAQKNADLVAKNRASSWAKENGKWKPVKNGKLKPVGGKRSTRKAKKSTRKTRKH